MGSWTALHSAYAQVSGEVATEIRICTETYHQKTKPTTTAQFFANQHSMRVWHSVGCSFRCEKGT